MVPSPSALVVLLGGIALGRAWYGVALVLAYGLGMAATLVGAGYLLLRARTGLERRAARRAWPRLSALWAALPVVTRRSHRRGRHGDRRPVRPAALSTCPRQRLRPRPQPAAVRSAASWNGSRGCSSEPRCTTSRGLSSALVQSNHTSSLRRGLGMRAT